MGAPKKGVLYKTPKSFKTGGKIRNSINKKGRKEESDILIYPLC
jgi:hypothetical protein